MNSLAASISRREALQKLSAGAMFTLGLWPGALAAGDAPSGSFRFLVVNDTHCMSQECCDYLREAVTQMKRAKADFCLHLGDLTDKADPQYFAAVKEIFGVLAVPMYPVIGNHDHAVHIIYTERRAYLQAFPERINYHFQHGGWQFVGLDTTQGTKSVDTTIQTDTLRWLEKNLPGLSKTSPTVVFTHFPLGPGVLKRPVNADDLLDRFRDFNLRAVFSGHHHRFTERVVGNVVFTTNFCCSLIANSRGGPPEKGYFICTARDGRIAREFVEFKPKSRT